VLWLAAGGMKYISTYSIVGVNAMVKDFGHMTPWNKWRWNDQVSFL